MNSIGEAFIDNLKLLGFDPILHAVGMFNRILFDSNMFTHNADNNKAFEITSHFLFEKLDAQQTKKKFEHCWPITDYKIHSRLYRTAAYTWLQHLKCNGDLPSFVVVRRSYFEDCHGDHITDIMLALSTFVLHCNIQRELSTNDSLKSTPRECIIACHSGCIDCITNVG
ncbi:HAUS augmin-like complex subunit 6 [Spinellus fusiger]|nr:HAUS augmin-like complex subunit 6 [Spinellus fusiger]